MIVIEALVAAIQGKKIEIIEYPQSAMSTNARIELKLIGFTAAGEKKGDGNPTAYETISFAADVLMEGVGPKYISQLSGLLRKMIRFEYAPLPVPVEIDNPVIPGEKKTLTLLARFTKLGDGQFSYPEADTPMPVEFREPWRIVITYPASIVSDEED